MREIVAKTATAAESPGTIPGSAPASRSASSGSAGEARELVSRARQDYPESTLTRLVFVPTVEAAIALGRGAPAEAIAASRAAGPAEFGTVAGSRADAAPRRRLPGRRRRAGGAAEYQEVLDHRGTDPFAPMIPLAHLGLARAWRGLGDTAKSRHEYRRALADLEGRGSGSAGRPARARRTRPADQPGFIRPAAR